MRSYTRPSHAARLVWVCALVLATQLLGAGEASFVGEAITSSLVEPLLVALRKNGGYNETTGPTAFLRSFVDGQIVPYVNSCHVVLPDGQPDCAAIAGECAGDTGNCAYVAQIEGLGAVGLVIALMLAGTSVAASTLLCCSSRGCRGGESVVGMRAHSALHVLVGAVVLLSLLGFMSVSGLLPDVLALFSSFVQAADVPGEVGATGREVLAALGRRGAEFGAERAMLLEGLVALETAMLRAKVQVDGVGGALAWLQVLVEGCVNGTDHCGVVPPVPQHGAPPGPPGLNPCTYGGRAEFRDADFSAGGPHSWGAGQHPRGVPAELPGGRPSPACRDLSTGAAHTCPCCVACQGAARALADARAALPRAQDLGVLNATLPPEEAPAAAQRAAAAYAQPLASVAEALAPVRAGAGVAADKATYVSRLVLAGLLAVLLPLWVVLVRLCITLHRASTRAEAEDAASGLGTGTGAEGFPELLERCGHWGSMASARDRAAWRGERAHEAGRVAGCSERCGCSELNVEAFPGKSIAGVACLLAVLLAPALAALSLLVLPLSDLCSLLPASAGADVEPLLQVLDANGGEDGFAARGLKACLLPRHGGSVWTVAGVDDSAIDARLGLRNFSDVIPRAAVARALDAQRYAPYFADLLDALVDLAARATSVPGDFGVDSCPPAEEAFPGCAADEAALGAAIAARAAQAHVEGEALAATVAVLAELSRALAANVTALEARADAASAEMRILVWQAGTCDSMHAAWAGLRVALCEGVGPGLAAAWGALSLAIALFPLLALLACHVAQLDKTTPQTSGSADDEWSANERAWVSWRAEGAGAGQSESLGAASEDEGEDLPNDECVDEAEETSRLLPSEAGQGWETRSARERDRRARPPSHE